MPRGRPRKPRLSRMHAAVDAMSQYGFTEERVRKHVKELLREYGGDEGWPFIEGDAYRELIEAILREAERDDQEQVAVLCDAERDGQEQVALDGNQIMNKPLGDEMLAETSTRASDTQQDERPQENAPAAILAVAEPTSTEFVRSISVVNNAEADGNGWKDILLDRTSGCIEGSAIFVSENDKDLMTKVDSPRISQFPALPAPDYIPSLPPITSKRCPPHYGWIDSDEDENNDLMVLKPAPVLGAEVTPPREFSKRLRKRRTRWDERPDDP